MVTAKLRAIARIIFARQVMLFTRRKGSVGVKGFGFYDLHSMMLMAIELDRTHDNFVAGINEKAADEGQLHTLLETKKVIEDLENAGD